MLGYGLSSIWGVLFIFIWYCYSVSFIIGKAVVVLLFEEKFIKLLFMILMILLMLIIRIIV
jgi:hypothetical protein